MLSISGLLNSWDPKLVLGSMALMVCFASPLGSIFQLRVKQRSKIAMMMMIQAVLLRVVIDCWSFLSGLGSQHWLDTSDNGALRCSDLWRISVAFSS